MIEKNQMLTLDCTRLGSELEGICDHEGMAIFVPGALPGEKVEVQILKVAPRYAFGKVRNILTPSPTRVEPLCPVYAQCGGCSGQHMSYQATLESKRQQVYDCLTRIGGLALTQKDVPAVLGADSPWGCRNKTALPVGGTAADPLIGFYRRRSHMIVPTEHCPIAMEDIAPVVQVIKNWMCATNVAPYQEETGKGLLRHVIVRTSREGSVMVLLVSTSPWLPKIKWLVESLKAQVTGFCALHLSVNKARNNVILGRDSQKLWGEEVIYESLLGLRFEIPPLSFFQVNPAQTERLYETAINFAHLKPTDTVVDAYAGAGTIALCMASKCRQVIGIEIVPQAVESAQRNAERNGVKNVQFHEGAVESLLPRLVEDGLKPDAVMLDPPRKGVEPQVVEAVLKARPRRVVYVSCHVPTQARDVKLLCDGGYRLESCQPVDMFCYAGGVENVLSLIRTDEEE